MRKVYCIGETVYDIIFKNRVPKASKAGGSMLNSTVSMGKINLPVHFLSEYGTDEIGKDIDSFLKSNNVNTDFVYRYNEGKTSIAIAFLNENNDASYTFYKELPLKRMDIEFPKITSEDIVLFGSFYSVNHEIRKQLKNFIQQAKEAGALIIYDPNFRKAHLFELNKLMPFIIENMQMASIVRGSDEDFKMIFNDDTLEKAYEHVSDYCEYMVYSMNCNGVKLVGPNILVHQKSLEINPLSTIGAGDNLNAGLIYGFFKENIDSRNLNNCSSETWERIISHGIRFATDVCLSYDNYISDKFANEICPK
jgi:fructokinase